MDERGNKSVEAQLIDGFWNCECRAGFAHHRIELECKICGTQRSEGLMSEIDEIKLQLEEESEALQLQRRRGGPLKRRRINRALLNILDNAIDGSELSHLLNFKGEWTLADGVYLEERMDKIREALGFADECVLKGTEL